MDYLLTAIGASATDWVAWKMFFERTASFSHDAMHCVLGVVLQLAAAAVMRRSVGSWWPWLLVLTAELMNEWADLRFERWPDLAMQMGESSKDLLLTMVLPTLLLITCRRWPQIFRSR